MQSFVLPREPMGQPMGQPVEPRGPSGASSGDDASQARSINNMKQIMFGWHNFHDTHRQMPLVPVRPEHRDADGKPLLSWRVHILPFIEEQPLYEQFKLDEPWDSEHNRPLAAKMPAIFLSPDTDPRIAAEGKTRYLVPVGPGTPGGVGGAVKIADITDGTSNTIAIVEAPQSTAVVWTKPDDLELNLSTISALANSMQGSMIAAFYDGSVRMLDRSMPLPKLQAMLTHAGGEAID